MVLFNPTVHSTRRIGRPYALWFVKEYKQDAGGRYRRTPAGSWDWEPTPRSFEDTPPEGKVFQTGRSYYLTRAEAREAVADGVHGIYYTDSYDDEYSDYYVAKVNQPGVEAYVVEPIE